MTLAIGVFIGSLIGFMIGIVYGWNCKIIWVILQLIFGKEKIVYSPKVQKQNTQVEKKGDALTTSRNKGDSMSCPEDFNKSEDAEQIK